jgi:hypothetical protein
MTESHDQHFDRILEASLEEVLARRSPPDVADRVVQACRARGLASGNGSDHGAPALQRVVAQAVADTSSDEAPSAATAPMATAPMATAPHAAPDSLAIQAVGRGRRWAARRSTWMGVAAAASVLIAGALLGTLALHFSRSPEKGTASTDGAGAQKKAKDGRGGVAPSQVAGENKGQHPGDEGSRPAPGTTPEDSPAGGAFDNPSPFGPREVVGNSSDPPIAPEPLDPLPDAELVALIDEELVQYWTDYRATPAAKAPDSQWCRRVYLRILGRIPTVGELERFVRDNRTDKKERLVDELLYGDEYVEEFARNWTSIFTNALIGRVGGTQADDLASREGLQQYLRRSLYENKPYDQVAYELIAAEGASRPGAADYNGATNFLLAGMSDQATLATSRTARVFLGQQIQCTQCHDHPENDWKQNRFWELNAFFRQMHAERDPRTGEVRLADRDVVGDGGDADEAEIYYEQPSGKMLVAYPALSDTPAVGRSGLVNEVNRRDELARRIVGHDDFARAAVNRVWAHFFGYGFTRPFDDMGPHNPPSHPELLDLLAEQFRAHEFDVKGLIRWIALSRSFGLSSDVPAGAVVDNPTSGGTLPLFSYYYTRPMQPEEVFTSLELVAAAYDARGDFAAQQREQTQWLGQFMRNLGTDEGEESSTFQGTINQSLMMMNGPLMRRATSVEHSNLLSRVAASRISPEEKVEHLFLAALARKPNRAELALASRLVAAAPRANPAEPLEDIWWALLNSNEFILDH